MTYSEISIGLTVSSLAWIALFYWFWKWLKTDEGWMAICGWLIGIEFKLLDQLPNYEIVSMYLEHGKYEKFTRYIIDQYYRNRPEREKEVADWVKAINESKCYLEEHKEEKEEEES